LKSTIFQVEIPLEQQTNRKIIIKIDSREENKRRQTSMVSRGIAQEWLMILATVFPLQHVMMTYAYALTAPLVLIYHACGAAIGFPSTMFLLDSILKKEKNQKFETRSKHIKVSFGLVFLGFCRNFYGVKGKKVARATPCPAQTTTPLAP
jgi:hypothetical protein